MQIFYLSRTLDDSQLIIVPPTITKHNEALRYGEKKMRELNKNNADWLIYIADDQLTIADIIIP